LQQRVPRAGLQNTGRHSSQTTAGPIRRLARSVNHSHRDRINDGQVSEVAADNRMVAGWLIQIVSRLETVFKQLVLIPVRQGLNPLSSRGDGRRLSNEFCEFGNAGRGGHL
jgi:hypothetical protein